MIRRRILVQLRLRMAGFAWRYARQPYFTVAKSTKLRLDQYDSHREHGLRTYYSVFLFAGKSDILF